MLCAPSMHHWISLCVRNVIKFGLNRCSKWKDRVKINEVKYSVSSLKMPQGDATCNTTRRCFLLIFSSSLFVFIELLIRLDSNFFRCLFSSVMSSSSSFERVFNWSFRIVDIWKNENWHRRKSSAQKEWSDLRHDQIRSLILRNSRERDGKDNKLSLKISNIERFEKDET